MNAPYYHLIGKTVLVNGIKDCYRGHLMAVVYHPSGHVFHFDELDWLECLYEPTSNNRKIPCSKELPHCIPESLICDIGTAGE